MASLNPLSWFKRAQLSGAAVGAAAAAACAGHLRQPLAGFCRLETVDLPRDAVAHRDGVTFVTSEESMVTIVRIGGSRTIMGADQLDDLVEGMREVLAGYMDSKGHALQFWYARDPSRSAADVARMLRPARRAARQAKLDIDDILAERERLLPRSIAWEACYVAVWTHVAVMNRHEAKAAKAQARERAAAIPQMRDAAKFWLGLDRVRDRHRSFVEKLVQSMDRLNVSAAPLKVHEAARALRALVYPDMPHERWQPRLAGDPLPVRLPEDGNVYDVSNCAYPPLPPQIMCRPGESLSKTTCRIGDTLWSGLEMTLAPETVRPFGDLLKALADRDNPPPWRISFLIEGDGLAAMGLRAQLASVFSWASAENKRIHEAMRQLRDPLFEDGPVTRLRVNLATWAPADQERELAGQVETLRAAFESWGNAQVGQLAGDPVEGVMSSALGLDCASTAPPAAAPLPDVLAMLPWDRPASPWAEGPVLLRTEDGKPWPFAPGSSRQDMWVDVIGGPPGTGKSVLVNTLNLASALSPSTGQDGRLMRMAIIDIGLSSSGLIALLKDALPNDRKHEAAFHRLLNSVSNAINVFDTQLGCRHPLPTERAFLANFLALLCLQNNPGVDEIMEGVITRVIDVVFRMRSDEGQPRPYTPGTDLRVDDALAGSGIVLETRPTWWEVVDALMERGMWHAASLAQRHAVPTIMDCVAAVRDATVTDLFGGVTLAATGESAPAAFMRLVNSAVDTYPMLAEATRFDIGDARVVALDLDLVAGRGQDLKSAQQTAVAYMLARHVLARDFFLGPEALEFVNQRWRLYHERRIAELREGSKRLVMDEFHRASACEPIRRQVVADIREGRKWSIQICLASQLLDDFGEEIVELSTCVWILGVGHERGLNKICERFGLNGTTRAALKAKLTGPIPGKGAPIFAKMVVKGSRPYEHVVYNSLGPIEIWAFSTTAEDVQLRNRLSEAVGPREARQILGRVFPGGSAKAEIERRVRELADALGAESATVGVVDEMVEQLARQAQGVKFDKRRHLAARDESVRRQRS